MRAATIQLAVTLGLVAATACGDNRAQPPPAPDAGVPDAGEPAVPVDLDRRWLREGFGEPMALAVGDLDGDNSEDIVLGGRGIALVDKTARATHHPRWSVDWHHDPANVFSGGDNQWVHAMALHDVTGDGVQDVLAASSAKDGYLVDGATGGIVWRVPWEGAFHSTQLAVFAADDDGIPDVFPTGGRAAYSGATGTKLWDAAIPGFAVFAREAALTGYFGQDLLLTTEIDHGVGGAPPTPGTRDAVFAVSSAGEVLWSADVEGAPTGLASADLDGDLVDEAIVTTWQGRVYAIGATGVLFSVDLGGFPSAVHVADTDFDDAPTIFVGVSGATDADPWRIVALDAAGATLWTEQVGGRVTTLATEQLDDDFELELLVGAGTHETPPGRAYALDTSENATPRVRWSVETGLQVASFARAWIDGAAVLLVGSYDGVLRALEPASGALAWSYTSGGFVFQVSAGDLDGDGLDEVASGDDRGNVVISAPGDGGEVWTRRIDVGWGGAVTGVVVRELDGAGGPAEVIAVGARYGQAKWGVLHVWEGSGAQRATALLDDQPTAVDVGDLDGDGDLEVVVATRSGAGACKVSAFDGAAGAPLWSTYVATCETASIAVADVDGDGAAEVGYGDLTLGTPPHVALLGGGGAIRWSHVTPDDSAWVKLADGGLVHGGFSSGAGGHVTRRAAGDGAMTWRAALDGVPDPEAPGAALSGGTWFGALVPDVDGDGTDELAVSSETGAVTMLDGATGDARWTTPLEARDLGRLERHTGGPIAYVPATATTPAFLAVAQSNTGRSRAAAFSLSLDGALAGPYATEGEAHAVTVARLAAGVVGAAFGAGLGVYAYAAR